MPQALAVLNDLLKSDLSPADKFATAIDFDKVFGLKFASLKKQSETETPDEILKLIQERKTARENKDWKKADQIRDEIKALGFEIKDSGEETIASRI